MSLLIALVIGAIIGASGGIFLIRNLDILPIATFAGVIGAILGLAAYGLLGDGATGGLFSAVGILCEVVGALVVILLFGALQIARSHNDPTIEHDDTLADV